MAAYREVLLVMPDHAGTRVNLGTLLVRQGKLDEAAVQFKAALEADPENVSAHDYLARTEALLGQAN